MIVDNSIVSLHYKLCDGEGKELDSSLGQDPLVYMHSTGSLLPALERALTGKQVGERISVAISSEDAYGPHHQELVQTLPMQAFSGQAVTEGMIFNATGKDGQSQALCVKEIHQSHVVVDANHPLAGIDLTFDVGVIAVRAPTAAELDAGQVIEASATDSPD